MKPCLLFLMCFTGLAAPLGCGTPKPTVNDEPFRVAIADYLQANNMALKVKEIKEGPVIEGKRAAVSASLTHEQLGGPSVTWKFQFTKQSGDWHVTAHED
ncbi:MAG TPA: hypothetical protein QF564_16260 [Pirellulaceae bacterium]|nr:hypothetical protein [Pirellulaceae bacterium]